jgi:hypothetical protein
MSMSTVVWYVLAGLAIWSVIRGLYGILIGRRSVTWKVSVSVAGLGFGAAPALEGRPHGYALVAAGVLASASLISEMVERCGWFAPRRARHRQTGPGSKRDAGRYGHRRPMTELDQAEADLAALRLEHDRLERAATCGDLHEQQAAAIAIGRIAGQLGNAVAVVIHERALVRRLRWPGNHRG